MYLKFWLGMALSGLTSTEAFSQENLPAISTDRPVQTETPYLVVPGHLQLENGVNYEQITGGVRNIVVPTTLWRYGINKTFELRAVTQVSNFRVNNEPSVVGFIPFEAGVKIGLVEMDGCIPQTCFIGHLAFPDAASPEFKADYIAPSFRFTMQHELSNKFSLSYNVGMEWNGFEAEGAGIYTLTSGYSITDNLGAYIELFGFLPEESRPDHNLDGGLTYLVKNNILVDVSGGVGLNDNAIDFYGALGFSIRLPD